ncbi:MAG: superoxide dismutase [Candidatus Rokubacteria bacterium]|nr:superoxide dismutase [Candidatus Rokubacteria bacterium]
MSYTVQATLKPKALAGISDEQIDQHWKLYEGYVKATNELLADLGKARTGSRTWAELKRRLAFEWDGMALHELYFGNLAAGAALSPGSALATALGATWGDVGAWRKDLTATAAMRGSGWAILYHDAAEDRLFDWWVSDHELGHPAGLNPILVLDVWEHAYMVDHGAGGRAEYVAAFLENVRWEVVEQRFRDSRAGRVVART